MNNKKTLSPKDRFRILKRDGFRCKYCGRTAEEVKLQVDHIIPRSKGGNDEDENLITACVDCNIGKLAEMILPELSADFEEERGCLIDEKFLNLSENNKDGSTYIVNLVNIKNTDNGEPIKISYLQCNKCGHERWVEGHQFAEQRFICFACNGHMRPIKEATLVLKEPQSLLKKYGYIPTLEFDKIKKEFKIVKIIPNVDEGQT